MADEHISDVIVNAIVDELKETMQLDTEKCDDAYGFLIKAGRLQDSPVQNKNNITVHVGDPDSSSSEWADELARPDEQYQYVQVPTVSEIGGGFSGIFWWRRGTVNGELFYIITDYDRDKARQVANEVRRRIEDTLGTNLARAFVGLTDGYEQVIVFMPVKSQAMEAGGPRQHIWRIKVWWQALTSRV